MAIDNTQSADAIERDIERTQNSISDTVEELQERFSPRALMNSVLGDNADGADQLVTAAKTNPIGVALIGAGALMLASGRTGSSLKTGVSSLTDRFSRSNNRGVPAQPDDPYHRSYLAHMNTVEHRDNEDADSYRRRRDVARANYFMIERKHDEDETTFRDRLDKAGDALRERTSSFGDALSAGGQRLSDGASSAANSVSGAASSAASTIADSSRRYGAKAERAYEQNPIVGGLIAAAVGAILGAVIPETEYEDEMLGEYGQQARSTAADYADTAKSKAADLAEQGKQKAASAAETALDKADSKLDEASKNGAASGTTGGSSTGSSSTAGISTTGTSTVGSTTYRDPAAKI